MAIRNRFIPMQPPEQHNTETSEEHTPLLLAAPKDRSFVHKIATLVTIHKRMAITSGVVGVALVGILGYVVLQSEPAANQIPAASQRLLMGAETIVADGGAEYSTDGKTWSALKPAQKLDEGHKVKTAADGRVVINLDDGSAVRVNNSSSITLTSLAGNKIQITNDSGEVYTRVVASDRTFSVQVGKESYVALGTAYKTINRDTTKGVEVYHSQVSVKTAAQKVGEGKRFFQAHATADIDQKITDIPLDQLQKDAFLQWNLEQDKKSQDFKDKLGYLGTLEKTPAPAPEAPPAPIKPGATAGINLTGSAYDKGVKLSWTVTGLSVGKGFKIVKGLTANPTYGKDDGAFVDAASRSYSWSIKDGKTYNFRICIYNGDTCTSYSNNIKVTAPYVAPTPPSGNLNLQPVSGTTVSWTLSGSAPEGLKLVWSTTPGPTYPGSSVKFYDGASNAYATFTGDAGSTYYLRVCMYYDGGCVNYSNEITVVLP